MKRDDTLQDMNHKSYKMSEYSTIHGAFFYGPDGKRTFVEARPKIKIKV